MGFSVCTTAKPELSWRLMGGDRHLNRGTYTLARDFQRVCKRGSVRGWVGISLSGLETKVEGERAANRSHKGVVCRHVSQCGYQCITPRQGLENSSLEPPMA